jgi:acetyltransferase-like isoleucine patch superfamily enzyme
MEAFLPASFFELADSEAASLFDGLEYVWSALDRIKTFVGDRVRPNVEPIRRGGEVLSRTTVLYQGEAITQGFELKPGDATKGKFEVYRDGRRLEGAAVVYAGAGLLGADIELGPGVVVEPGAVIKGPAVIGPYTEVRQGAYVRGDFWCGPSCIVGHATETKTSIMLDGAKAGHFAYLGDSILGREVNLGAGTKLANLKIMPWPYRIKCEGRVFEVDRRKFGAILGDKVETGCNSVTSPGTLMAPGCLVAPNMTVPGGYHPHRTFINDRIPGR